jgi:multimeric flavodoxin WrbA
MECVVKQRIVGFSASLRNARSGEGARELVAELAAIPSREELVQYLEGQGNLYLDRYYQAGRANGLPYDELYKNLKKMGGRKGLSNSEACLAVALWGGIQSGAEVDMIPLADHFLPDGSIHNLERCKAALREADGVIISTPVYFGDRSSLSQRLITTIQQDPQLQEQLDGKVYGGLTVGAKRNGGQETALIYQMHDMMNLGFVGVGNDFETTSQYGGTGHAGDVGMMAKDEYGLNTCIGLGRRVARTASLLRASRRFRLKEKVRLGVWVLQEKDGKLLEMLEPILAGLSDAAEVDVVSLHEKDILPCMACDICPPKVTPDSEYSCIRGKSDQMNRIHQNLLQADVVLPAMLSTRDRRGLQSVYQHFLERTRYIRRGDYKFTDKLIAPLVFSDVGSNENLNLRMCTSLIRHHTIMHRSITGWLHEGRLLNPGDVNAGVRSAVELGARIAAGRLTLASEGAPMAVYKPVGYILSLTKDNTSESMSRREAALQDRHQKLMADARIRLEAVPERDGQASK